MVRGCGGSRAENDGWRKTGGELWLKGGRMRIRTNKKRVRHRDDQTYGNITGGGVGAESTRKEGSGDREGKV